MNRVSYHVEEDRFYALDEHGFVRLATPDEITAHLSKALRSTNEDESHDFVYPEQKLSKTSTLHRHNWPAHWIPEPKPLTDADKALNRALDANLKRLGIT